MDQMIAPLRKYADFYGRATRTEYWLFFLFRMILAFVFAIVFFGVVAATRDGMTEDELSIPATIVGLIGLIGYLALLLPELAVTVRRLHDQNLSGWLVLIGLVPGGGFVLLVFKLLKGTNGPNNHGPDPRAPVEPTARIFS